jgi:hypothetical protein
LAPSGDPGDIKFVDDRHLLPDRQEGRVIAQLVADGRIEIVPGSYDSGLSSVAVGAEQDPSLIGFDLIVDLEGAAAVAVSTGVTIPAGALLLDLRAKITEVIVAGGTSVAASVGTGTAGDPDLYGLSADLLKNSALDPGFFRVPLLAALAGATEIFVTATTAAGVAGDTPPLSGKVRVKASWLEAPAELPDVP